MRFKSLKSKMCVLMLLKPDVLHMKSSNEVDKLQTFLVSLGSVL